MNRAFASCFSATFQVCPLTSLLFRKSTQNAEPVSPDVPYEKSNGKRPTIVINSLDSNHFIPGPYYEENKENIRKISNASSRSPGGDCYAARINFTTQYITSKKTLILKVKDCSETDMECFDSETLSQIRVLIACAKAPKQQTAYTSGFHPVFEECLLFTNIEENDLLAARIRFRLYVKRGKNRPDLIGETELRGKSIAFDGPPLAHSLKLGGPPPKFEEEEFSKKPGNPAGLGIDKAPAQGRPFSNPPQTAHHRVGSFKYAFQARMNKAVGSSKSPKPPKKPAKAKKEGENLAETSFTASMPTPQQLHHRYSPVRKKP